MDEVVEDDVSQCEAEVKEQFRSTLSSFSFEDKSPRRLQRSRTKTVPKTYTLKSENNSSGSSTPRKRGSASESEEGPAKQKKRKRGYATPETYAHLQGLQDILADGLDIVFCGINPGQRSAEIGHHFGHPTNHFWACLHESGLTSEKLRPQEDHTLPDRFCLGLTNLVERPTAEQNELSPAEQASSVPALLSKIALYRPRIVCFIGLGIAKTFQRQIRFKSSTGKKVKIPPSKEGLQVFKMVHSDNGDDGIKETIFYAIPSTSGRVVHAQKPQKIHMFTDLRHLLSKVKRDEVDTTGMYTILPP